MKHSYSFIIVTCLFMILSTGLPCAAEDAKTYFDRGLANAEKGLYDQAIKDFTEALQRDPKFAAAYANRGVAYGKKKLSDKAIADLTQALKLDPNDATTYSNRGNAFADKGNHDQAIADYSKAIELKPTYGTPYRNRATSYYHKKQYDKAWNDVRHAEALGVKNHPEFLEALKKASNPITSQTSMEAPGISIRVATDEESLAWEKENAAKSNPLAQCRLGARYLLGRGVEKDSSKALKWYSKAADQGDAQGQLLLGGMYFEGTAVGKDYTKAYDLFKKAAIQGNAEAMGRVGMMHEHGLGVDKSISIAVEWFEKAAKAGHPNGQAEMGKRYLSGFGVPEDHVKAYAWLSLAEQSHPQAAEIREALNLIRATLSEKQISEAEKMMKQWKISEPRKEKSSNLSIQPEQKSSQPLQGEVSDGAGKQRSRWEIASIVGSILGCLTGTIFIWKKFGMIFGIITLIAGLAAVGRLFGGG